MRLHNPPPPIELWIDEPTTVEGDRLEFGCRLALNPARSIPIWFRFPADQGPRLTRLADPFVVATIVFAMKEGRPLHVRGTVSAALLSNLAEFQSAFAAFHGAGFKPVEIKADRIFSSSGFQRSEAGITAFSGGVDGAFSIFRHTALSSFPAKRPLHAALLVHGFDIPLADRAVFGQVAGRCREFARDAGLTLHTAATNIRTLPLNWETYFGSAVASALLFFQSAYTFALLPSAHDFHHMRFDGGSNQVIDPLLSTSLMQIVHDGSGFGRIDKLAQLATWPAARKNLRVCWEGGAAENCCRCEKCVRTILMLSFAGVEECEAFPLPLTPATLDHLVVRSEGGLHELEYLLEETARHSPRPWWFGPLSRAVQRNHRYLRWREIGRRSSARLPSGLRQSLSRMVRQLLLRPVAQPGRAEAASPPPRLADSRA